MREKSCSALLYDPGPRALAPSMRLIVLLALSLLAAASEELPAAWSLAAWDEANAMPRMELPAADAATYLDLHGPKFGVHARNVLHIAPQVLIPGSPHLLTACKAVIAILHPVSSLCLFTTRDCHILALP